jgi:hypothetical protein
MAAIVNAPENIKLLALCGSQRTRHATPGGTALIPRRPPNNSVKTGVYST